MTQTAESLEATVSQVTILGAGSEVGMVASFMLKQQAIVHYVAMYDECACVLGAATDLAHIDTSAGVEAYQVGNYFDWLPICVSSH